MIRTSARALLFIGEKLVIVKHQKEGFPDYYVLPGGGVEQGESLEDAVIREVREETGYQVKVVRLAYYKTVFNDKDTSLDFIFHVTEVGARQKPRDPDNKIKEVMAVNATDLEKLHFHPKQLKERVFSERSIKEAQSLGKAAYPEY